MIQAPARSFRSIDDVPILKLIGNTPLLRIRLFEREFPHVEVWAKAEWFNPGGSVKDRPALSMVRDGLERGLLRPGMTLLDSTSGNTGIAYAMIGAALGIPVKLVLPANASPERKGTLKAYGAEMVFSSALEGSDGAQRLARRIYEEDPEAYFLPCQYDNPANPLAHENGTAVEILEQTGGRVTHFVAGLGTTGTLVGTGRGLKKRKADVKVCAVMPAEPFHGLEGMKHIPTAIRPGIYEEAVHDQLILAGTEDSYQLAERLAHEEGLFVGHSSGAALVGAREVAERARSGVIVVIFPDSGDRYLSEMH
ncbi:MAG: cysteine synthase family protein [Candidatus Tectomicrobia bacterium]|uniref:Cysteine synthase family protein n=1 Tax=Tectimicrobiota bacterium TaxID=2528274 RepID=A0A932I474_UNCTE|nr:cysteine synthase family protein [Candidatus Tectomicrobia bacterium]